MRHGKLPQPQAKATFFSDMQLKAFEISTPQPTTKHNEPQLQNPKRNLNQIAREEVVVRKTATTTTKEQKK